MSGRHAIKIADQVWIAAAMLHREFPDREGFTSPDLEQRIRQEFGTLGSGIATHLSQHCIANKKANPARYRILVEEYGGFKRLFRPGDVYHPDREGGKDRPHTQDVPARYHPLLDWYESTYTKQKSDKGSVLKEVSAVMDIPRGATMAVLEKIRTIRNEVARRNGRINVLAALDELRESRN